MARKKLPQMVFLAIVNDMILGCSLDEEKAEEICKNYMTRDNPGLEWKNPRKGKWFTPSGPVANLRVEGWILR